MGIDIVIPMLGEKKNLREFVINFLIMEYPVSTRRIQNAAKKNGLEVSYQAVHKMVKKLVEQEVLIKKGMKYQLNMEWVKKVRNFTERMENSLERGEPVLRDVLKKETTNLVFNNPMEFADFIVEMLEIGKSETSRTIVAQWYHMNSPMFLSKKNFERLKKIASKDRFYFICNKKNFVDRWLAKSWEKINVKVKLGIPCATNCDIFVIDDFVIQVYWPKDLKKIWYPSAESLRKIMPTNILKIYQAISHGKFDVNVIVNKNFKVAEQIRKETLKYF
ncbi:MAG: hypothetical protein GTN76_03945 [Candidatus Aenigmarchaeota archaeon]|nr:hypothetical protein [Candidatus Aenigmarchaeota archaeon]